MRLNKLLLAMAASGIATSAFATNGDLLIGLGAQSRALGGTGTAAFYGSENALTNPALIAKSKGTEFAIGGTVFMPDVQASSDVANPAAIATQTSDADQSIIPEVSMVTNINDKWTFGLGMYGTAGMGVDYRDTAGLFRGYTNLQLMKFAPTFAYNGGKMGFGVAPVIQYGALDINYVSGQNTIGEGTSTDLGFGYNLGAYFDLNDSITVGVSYQSPVDMEYKNQITTAANGFGIGPNGMGTITTNHLEQPAEIKIGIAHTTGPWTVTGDYKQVKWSDAKGYKDFNWKDQDVYAVGFKYAGSGYWLGLGYNHGNDPIEVLPDAQSMVGYSNQAVNLFNNHFFPGIVESHITLGGGLSIGKNTSIDMAVVYADEVTKTVNSGTISAVMGAAAQGGDAAAQAAAAAGAATNMSTHTTNHSQFGYTVSVRMNF